MGRFVAAIGAELLINPALMSVALRLGEKSDFPGIQHGHAIVRMRPVRHRIAEETLKIAMTDYGKLSAETAERTVRFWQLHDRIEK
jgi:hypothetical protein